MGSTTITKNNFTIKLYLIFFMCAFFICLPLVALAQQGTGYVSLTELPIVEENNTDLAGYLNAIYLILIGVGTLFAVIKIAIAGVQYSMSDVITSKESAKKSIWGALIGLAILLLPFVVLNTIYPGLINLNILGGANPLAHQAPPSPNRNGEGVEKLSPNEITALLNNCKGPDGTSKVRRFINNEGNPVACCLTLKSGPLSCPSDTEDTDNELNINVNDVYKRDQIQAIIDDNPNVTDIGLNAQPADRASCTDNGGTVLALNEDVPNKLGGGRRRNIQTHYICINA